MIESSVDGSSFGGRPRPAAHACTSALCGGEATTLVSWASNPEGLPFCDVCAGKLEAHGDVVSPLAGAR
jgi:hypothetical protein